MRRAVRVAALSRLQGGVRLVARLDRGRRGRPDAPADRAARGDARDARHPGDPSRGRERDRRGVARAHRGNEARPRSSSAARRSRCWRTRASARPRASPAARTCSSTRSRPRPTSCSSAPAPRCSSASARTRRSRRRACRCGSCRCRRWELFAALPDDEQAEVLPPGVLDARGRGRRRRSAGSATPTTRSAIDHFGASAPGGRDDARVRLHRRRTSWPTPRRCSHSRRTHDQRDRPAQRLRPEPLVRQHHPHAASRGGGLAKLIDEDGIRGVTSNPTIFDKAIGGGEGYDEQLLACAKAGMSIEDTYWAVVLDDIVAATNPLLKSNLAVPPRINPQSFRYRPPPPRGSLLRRCETTAAAADLSTSVGSLRLRNPIIAASGTFGYGIEFAHLVDLNALGAFVVKGLSREPIAGAPAPRVIETPSGMLNAIGLQNIGVRAFVAEKLPVLRKYDTPVIANVFGYTLEDYVEVIRNPRRRRRPRRLRTQHLLPQRQAGRHAVRLRPLPGLRSRWRRPPGRRQAAPSGSSSPRLLQTLDLSPGRPPRPAPTP